MENNLDKIKEKLLKAKCAISKAGDMATTPSAAPGGGDDLTVADAVPMANKPTFKADPPAPSLAGQGVSSGTVSTDAATAIMQGGGFFHKDELDEKIKAKMKDTMAQRGIGGKQIADHYRDIDETVPAKQRSNIKAAVGKQNASKPKLTVAKEEDFQVEQPEVHKAEGGGGGVGFTTGITAIGSNVTVNGRGKKKDPKIKAFPHSVFQQSEKVTISKNGQWNMEKSGYGPKGAGLYNPADNIKRKANNTGEAVVDAGKNVNVKNYTTSGSSVAQATEAAEAKRQAAANKKAPVKTLADMSDDEKAKLEAKYGAKIKKEE